MHHSIYSKQSLEVGWSVEVEEHEFKWGQNLIDFLRLSEGKIKAQVRVEKEFSYKRNEYLCRIILIFGSWFGLQLHCNLCINSDTKAQELATDLCDVSLHCNSTVIWHNWLL